jgi:hypothetical protein
MIQLPCGYDAASDDWTRIGRTKASKGFFSTVLISMLGIAYLEPALLTTLSMTSQNLCFVFPATLPRRPGGKAPCIDSARSHSHFQDLILVQTKYTVDVVDLVAQGQILERQALDASPDVSDRSQDSWLSRRNMPRNSVCPQHCGSHKWIEWLHWLGVG